MAMSRKHYREVAEILNDHLREIKAESREPGEIEVVESIAANMAEFFKRDNGNFQYGQFYKAVGMDVPSRHVGAR